MTRMYKETPDNFSEIQKFLVEENYIGLILMAKHCFFYDTCSIVRHSNSRNRKKIADYIYDKEGIVILTRTVLMELQNSNNIIEDVQIKYIQDLYDKGIKIVLLNEEDIFNILNEVISISISDSNKLLGLSINTVSKSKGIVYEIKTNDPQKIVDKMFDSKSRVQYYKEFFELARSNKRSQDNLAEELMFICFIVLSRIPLINKLVFLSNDLKSREIVLSINKYTRDKHHKEEPYQLTSAKLIFNLFKSRLIEHKEDIVEMFNKSTGGDINVYYMGEYDIDLKHKSFSKEELADNIFEQKEFKVIY